MPVTVFACVPTPFITTMDPYTYFRIPLKLKGLILKNYFFPHAQVLSFQRSPIQQTTLESGYRRSVLSKSFVGVAPQ